MGVYKGFTIVYIYQGLSNNALVLQVKVLWQFVWESCH